MAGEPNLFTREAVRVGLALQQPGEDVSADHVFNTPIVAQLKLGPSSILERLGQTFDRARMFGKENGVWRDAILVGRKTKPDADKLRPADPDPRQ